MEGECRHTLGFWQRILCCGLNLSEIKTWFSRSTWTQNRHSVLGLIFKYRSCIVCWCFWAWAAKPFGVFGENFENDYSTDIIKFFHVKQIQFKYYIEFVRVCHGICFSHSFFRSFESSELIKLVKWNRRTLFANNFTFSTHSPNPTLAEPDVEDILYHFTRIVRKQT